MIDTEATERFMAAPWLAEVDRDTKRSDLERTGRGAGPDRRHPARAGSAQRSSLVLDRGDCGDRSNLGPAAAATSSRILTAPAVFGTTSFFQPKPPTVTVRATSDVWILSLVSSRSRSAARGRSSRRRSAGPGGRPRLVGTVRPDRQAVHRLHIPAFRRAREEERVGGVSRPVVRGARHLSEAPWPRVSARKPEFGRCRSIDMTGWAGDRRSSDRLGG